MGEPFRITVLPGDGIGVDVTREAKRVLEAVAAKVDGLSFVFSEESAGAGTYLEQGNPLPDAVIESCSAADAVLLGAMGLPNVRWPDGKEMTPQIDLREKLQLYAGLRPIYLFHTDDSPLKDYEAGEIDFLLVRESTEGLFSGRLSEFAPETGEVRDVMRITRTGSERVIRAAFQEASRRRGKVTLIDKANVLPSMVFFREVFDEVATEFPEIETERIYVDAAALFLVTRPDTFDVLVTENMFGDILSDLGAGLIGGMGMAPSGDVGDDCAVFQPSHGTAPDIAGRGIANPVATILSGAMMLEWLGTEPAKHGGRMIDRAVKEFLRDSGNRTPDGGGSLTTVEMGDGIIDLLAS
ncbi:MAG: isocitrate/isopropylmalate dehydrogenase family protein [Verrucomicrobiota bacterium]